MRERKTALETYMAIARIMQDLDSGDINAAYAHIAFEDVVQTAPASLNLSVPTIAELEERCSQDTLSYEQSYESSQSC